MSGVVLIPLTQGRVTIIDEADAAQVLARKWFASVNAKGRAIAVSAYPDRGMSLHRFLMRPRPGEPVDHINGDPLDNRRANLRLATPEQNAHNRHAISGTSRYQGVSWSKHCRKWYAQIRIHYKKYNLGVYHSEEDAARAYDRAAREAYGEFACQNFR